MAHDHRIPMETNMAHRLGERPVSAVFRAAARGDLRELKRIALRLSLEGGPANTFTKLKDVEGRTAFHIAAAVGKTQICKYLIRDLKLDVNLRDDSGNTPLNYAVLAEKYQTVVFLVENGANPNLANDNKFSALHYAAQKGLPRSQKLVELLIAKGVAMEAESASGTPLQCAVAKGKKEVVKILLDCHANPNVTGNSFTPLVESILAESIECTILLLKAGADPNLRSPCGPLCDLPLFYAAVLGEIEALRLLLKSGADPNVTDDYGMTPLEVAARHGCHEVAMILFPATQRIPEFPDWSLAGIRSHVHSEQYKMQRKEKNKEGFRLLKAKGEEAFKRKDYVDAIYWYTQAISVDSSDASVLSNRSLCWVRLDEGEKALVDAVACVTLKPDWAKAHYREGVARRMVKDFFGAIEAFSKALALDPENQEIKIARREAVEAKVQREKLLMLSLGFQYLEMCGPAVSVHP